VPRCTPGSARASTCATCTTHARCSTSWPSLGPG
jgi:hypothetical protein